MHITHWLICKLEWDEIAARHKSIKAQSEIESERKRATKTPLSVVSFNYPHFGGHRCAPASGMVVDDVDAIETH